jgi:pimeloyl-ACP methyl ester carboxylesterase
VKPGAVRVQSHAPVETSSATVTYRKKETARQSFSPWVSIIRPHLAKCVPALSGQFTCYAFDLVGLGGTTSNVASDFSSPGQAGVLQQALSILGVAEYALVGNDTAAGSLVN